MRRRWVYVKGEAIEVSADYEGERRTPSGEAVLWNDRLYQDDSDTRYRSRSQHREFMKRHGLTTADDFKEQWKRDEKDRAARLAGVDKTRKGDINEAINKLQAGYRPRIERYREIK